jgi:anti-anti-sigma regulatory factor
MKFTSYATRLDGRTAYVLGGKALDMDLEGGLEEVLERLVKAGARRIVLTLGTMKFFHYTLLAGLLATQRKLTSVGGDLVLARVPWFVENTLEQLGLLHKFAIVPDATTVERAERMRVDLGSSEDHGRWAIG